MLMSACSGQAQTPSAQAHPDGWQQAIGKSTVWIDPRDRRERFTVASNPNAKGTMSDLASEVTTDALLTHKGARLSSAVPYPGCPGESGLQTFTTRTGGENGVLRIAFTQWNGSTIVAAYERPAPVPDSPAAVNALTRAVCTAVAGAPTLPPVSR